MSSTKAEQAEETAKLLWRYHDWLTERGYVLCTRTSVSVADGGWTVSYQPVIEGADLIARFVAWIAEQDREEDS